MSQKKRSSKGKVTKRKENIVERSKIDSECLKTSHHRYNRSLIFYRFAFGELKTSEQQRSNNNIIKPTDNLEEKVESD